MSTITRPRIAVDAADARDPKLREAFTLRDGVPVTLLRIDTPRPVAVAFYVDGLRGEGAGAARVDWELYALADPACEVEGAEPIAKGSGYYTLPETRTGLVFQVSGIVATSFYLVATLSGSIPVSVKASALAADALGDEGITAGNMIG